MPIESNESQLLSKNGNCFKYTLSLMIKIPLNCIQTNLIDSNKAY